MVAMMAIGDVWFSGAKLWLLWGEWWCLSVVYSGLLLAMAEQGTMVRGRRMGEDGGRMGKLKWRKANMG